MALSTQGSKDPGKGALIALTACQGAKMDTSSWCSLYSQVEVCEALWLLRDRLTHAGASAEGTRASGGWTGVAITSIAGPR